MNLEPIIERIRDECPVFKLVSGAADFARLSGALTTVPAAFVLPAAESAEPSPFGNQLVQQEVRDDFVVVIAARNLADATGLAANETLQPLRDVLFDALLAWVPAEDYANIEFRRGEFSAFDNDILWWADTFLTGHMIRSI